MATIPQTVKLERLLADVPEELKRKVEIAAKRRGLTLRAYLITLLETATSDIELEKD